MTAEEEVEDRVTAELTALDKALVQRQVCPRRHSRCTWLQTTECESLKGSKIFYILIVSNIF